MKKFMQMLLASFGILTLVLAGCSSTEGVEEEVFGEEDTSVVEDTTSDSADEDASEEEAAE